VRNQSDQGQKEFTEYILSSLAKERCIDCGNSAPSSAGRLDMDMYVLHAAFIESLRRAACSYKKKTSSKEYSDHHLRRKGDMSSS
jgi:hypothetical protein